MTWREFLATTVLWKGRLGPKGFGVEFGGLWSDFMHYPHRISRIKRKRSIGFRARMKSVPGRKMMNRKRRVGRSLNVADK